MNRRDILRYTAWLTGSAVSAPLAGALLSGCSSDEPPALETGDIGELHFFTPEQFALLALLADTILPRTDSPSATDVSAHYRVDAMLGKIFEADYRDEFRHLWTVLEAYLSDADFVAADDEQRVALLRELELNQTTSLAEPQKALLETKQMLVVYYLTTEAVATNYLNHRPIPGRYEPCIPVEEVDNTAWALHR